MTDDPGQCLESWVTNSQLLLLHHDFKTPSERARWQFGHKCGLRPAGLLPLSLARDRQVSIYGQIGCSKTTDFWKEWKTGQSLLMFFQSGIGQWPI